MIEQSIRFGDGAGLIGTLCLPQPAGKNYLPPQAGIILFNAGIVHRIGPHRINVRLARSLAKLGIPSLRFDLAGLGDSARADGTLGFEQQAVKDIGFAMSTLGDATGLQKFGLFGFCSGAFHSFNTALVNPRVAGIMLFDAYRFSTTKSTMLRFMLRLRQHGLLTSLQRLATKIFTSIRGILTRSANENIRFRVSDLTFIADSISKKTFAEGVRKLLDRGTDVSMTFAGDGFEVYNYANQFRDALRGYGIAHRIPTTFFPDIDHVATGIHAQKVLIDHLVVWCDKIAGRLPCDKIVSDLRQTSIPSLVRYSDRGGARLIAVVLSRTITGLATVRCLAKAGIEVHAIYFEKKDPVRLSRFCKAHYFDASIKDEQELLDFLDEYCRQLGQPAVAVPTCDAHALLLAANRERLLPHCKVMTAELIDLNNVIYKNQLHIQIEKAGLDLIPSLVAPTISEAAIWSGTNPGPYLIKPYYAGVTRARLKQKNLVIPTRDALLTFVSEGDMQSMIVQRIIRGGDGFIFDCYGYCDTAGNIVTMASRRRIHQNLPDYGTCTMGQIPAYLDPDTEQKIFAKTRRFFQFTHYQGIFGIEWLCEQQSGHLYLIDFNARPFMGIGHAMAAGINLPALAYAEMIGEDLSGIEQTPRLKSVLAVDMLRDIESLQVKRQDGRMDILEWLGRIIKCRYFYYTDWRDPLPGIARALEIMRRGIAYLVKTQGKSNKPGLVRNTEQ